MLSVWCKESVSNPYSFVKTVLSLSKTYRLHCQRNGRWQLKSRCQPTNSNPPDGSILIRWGPETTDHRMSSASAVHLHVWCCYLSLVSGMMWLNVGRPPLPSVFITLKHFVLLEIFTCGLWWRLFLPKLYCLIDNHVILYRVLMTKINMRICVWDYEFLLRSCTNCRSS